jgi:hypothetical protein
LLIVSWDMLKDHVSMNSTLPPVNGISIVITSR